MNRIKFLLFIFLIFVFLETFSWHGHIVFPYEDHQRYGVRQSLELLSKRNVEEYLQKKDPSIFFKRLFPLRINGRSAIGELFQGQKTQIAFFGTSTLFEAVSMDKSWPELLRKFSHNKIHVDNFAYYDESFETLKKKLDSLCLTRRFYDLLVIQISNMEPRDKEDHFQNRFKPIPTVFPQIYQKTKQWLDRSEDENLLLFKFFQKKPFYLHFHLNGIVAMKELRKKKGVFINYNLEAKQSSIDEASHLIPKILDKAECLSNQVFWLTEPFAWSEGMLNSYTKSHFQAFRAPTNNPHVFKFANIKSVGLRQIQYVSAIKKILQKQKREIIIIDLFDFIQKEISNNSDLFVDEGHLSEKGHELAFQFILPYFLEYMPELRQF